MQTSQIFATNDSSCGHIINDIKKTNRYYELPKPTFSEIQPRDFNYLPWAPVKLVWSKRSLGIFLPINENADAEMKLDFAPVLSKTDRATHCRSWWIRALIVLIRST